MSTRPLARLLDAAVGLIADRVERHTPEAHGPETLLRIRALVLFTAVLVVLALTWGVGHLVAGRLLPGSVYLLQLPLVLFALAFLLSSGHLRASSHLVVAIGMVSVGMATALTGGLQYANITPFFMLVVVPVFLLGRPGFAWAASSLVLALAFELAGRWGVVFPNYAADPELDAMTTWLVSGAVVLGFVAFYEANRARGWRELRGSHRALAASEVQYRRLVDNAHESILVVQDGAIRFHNPKLRSLTSRSAGDLDGSPFSSLVHPDDLDEVAVVLGRLLCGGEMLSLIEVRVVDALQAVRWVEVVVERITWEERPALLLFLNDVTKRHHTRQALRQREEELRQAQKMEAIGRLAGGVAHDFNNHLTTIMGGARLILDHSDPDWPLMEDAEEIHASAERAAQLTHQLLAFSRKQVLRPVVLEPNAAVEGLARMLRRLIGEDIQLDLFLGTDLPRVRADEGQLSQVLMNLAVNARDAMPLGGSLVLTTALVQVDHPPEGAQPGPYVRIQVEDDGVGMDAETAARVFEPFFTTRESGTGLGLAVAYGIAKQHGGWMDVRSTPEVGTTFEVYLPAEERTATPAPLPERVEGPRGTGQRILLVEDDSQVRRMALRFMEDWGYRVAPVDSSEEAMALLALDDDFALLFSDVVLPGVNGMALAEEVRVAHPHIRVLLSSGYTDERARWDEIQERQLPFLHKPYTMETLLTAVHSALAG